MGIGTQVGSGRKT